MTTPLYVHLQRVQRKDEGEKAGVVVRARRVVGTETENTSNLLDLTGAKVVSNPFCSMFIALLVPLIIVARADYPLTIIV